MSYPLAINHSQAIKLIAAQVSAFALGTEVININNATGRILAEDLLATRNVPEHDSSRMDGYAINLAALQMLDADVGAEYVLELGSAVHAAAQNERVSCGQLAIPVMTGAVLPQDADAIIIKEQVCIDNNKIHFNQLPKKHQYFRTAGADIQAGQVVIKAEQQISMAHLGLMASLGLTTVTVTKQPRVALMMSGDELVQPGEVNQLGQTYDANSGMLKQLLISMGCEVESFATIADRESLVQARFEQLKQMNFDFIITVGGVSMGDKDWIPQVLNELGEVVFHKVRVKPGFPLLFGQLGKSLFFGLPGNPVSAYTTLCQYVFSAIKVLNQQAIHKQVWRADLLHDWHKSHFRREYLRGFFDVGGDGHIQVRVCGKQQSSRIESLAEANCFIVLDEAHNELKVGDRVNIQPFSQFKV